VKSHSSSKCETTNTGEKATVVYIPHQDKKNNKLALNQLYKAINSPEKEQAGT
jgi:hypothetical protein